MAAELTGQEVDDLALEIAKKGGKRGRSIFYKFCFEMQDEHPEFVMDIMERILPELPEQDRQIILYCLDEYNGGRTLDLRKMVTDEIEGAIRQTLFK